MLEVTGRTIRNRIKEGKLKAIKRIGPYGDQYYLEDDQFKHIAKTINEVVEIEERIPLNKLENSFKQALKQDRKVIKEEVKHLITINYNQLQKDIEQLKQENKQLKKEIKQDNQEFHSQLQADLKQEREKLVKKIKEYRRKEKKESLLDKVKRLFK